MGYAGHSLIGLTGLAWSLHRSGHLALLVWTLLISSCSYKTTQHNTLKPTIDLGAKEMQLTSKPQGHFLNQRQVFSPDDAYIVFDGRNDDSKIGENGSIGLLDVKTGETKTIYQVSGQASFGPGVGAVSYNPRREEVVFIHGLLDASEEEPYRITARSAVGLDLEDKESPTLFQMDARDVNAPFTAGALRGGTHAYGYSADGEWVSFTYNDLILEKEATTNPEIKDLRTVGFMFSGRNVSVIPAETHRRTDFSGTHFSVLAARVVPFPSPGSDEIQKAYEEVWIGNKGYLHPSGKRIRRALAYQGDLLDKDGNLFTEVFVSDIPDDIEQLVESPGLQGTGTSLPTVPEAVVQRRITYTSDRKYKGVQGPRQWLRTSPEGDRIFYYAKSDDGLVQIYSISPNGGEPEQVSNLSFSPDTMFSLSPDGLWIAFGAGNQLYLLEVESGKTVPLGPSPSQSSPALSNINWSFSGKKLAYNRKVDGEGGSYFQIFIIEPFKKQNQAL